MSRKAIIKEQITVNAETSLQYTVKVTLVHPKKDAEGNYYIQTKVGRYVMSKKQSLYLVQILDKFGEVVHFTGHGQCSGLTANVVTYTKYVEQAVKYLKMLQWREENPSITPYDIHKMPSPIYDLVECRGSWRKLNYLHECGDTF